MARVILKAILYKLGIFSKKDLVRAYRYSYSQAQRAHPVTTAGTGNAFLDTQRANFRVQ